MTLLCVGSAHGSPGVTTSVLALAAVWPGHRRLLLVEADPWGGVLAARFGLHDTPGLASLAASASQGLDTDAVWAHSQTLPGGVPILVTPPRAESVEVALLDAGDGLARWAGSVADVDVVVDCGRLSTRPPVQALLEAADVTWTVVRPRLDQLRPAAARMEALTGSGVAARLVCVGERPYGPEEVSSGFGVAVAGVIADDPRTAASLSGISSARGFARSMLIRSAASLADTLPIPVEPSAVSAVGVG